MDRDDSLADDISAVQHMALETMAADPKLAERLVKVACAASAWHTLLVDRRLERRLRPDAWPRYVFVATLIACATLGIVVWRFGVHLA